MTNEPIPLYPTPVSPIDRPGLAYMELTGKLYQHDLEVTGYITANKVAFGPREMGGTGISTVLRLEPDVDGVDYRLNEQHPHDELIERIAMVLTHPAMVREFFQLLNKLGLSAEEANDYVSVKIALLKHL